MKKFVILFFVSILNTVLYSQIYIGDSCKVNFFSANKMENIDATNSGSKPIFNCSTKEITYKLSNTAFKFKSHLMENHFNETYMESDKFPYSTFKGTINEKIDYTKDSTYKVTVTGILSVHGVDMERTINGTLGVKNGKLTIHSKFIVTLKDHNIKTPSVMTYSFADQVEVTVESVLVPYK